MNYNVFTQIFNPRTFDIQIDIPIGYLFLTLEDPILRNTFTVPSITQAQSEHVILTVGGTR